MTTEPLPYGITGPSITEYGCTRCQRHHRRGIDAEYEAHLIHMSKHGTSQRPPLDIAETFAAEMMHDQPKGK